MSANASEQTDREAFEAWFSDGGEYPLACQRAKDGGYLLAQAESSWSAWQACSAAHASELRSLRDSLALARSHIVELREALRSFVYEFGDKTNSATVNKARAALKEKGE